MTEDEPRAREPMSMGVRIMIVVAVALAIALAFVLREGRAPESQVADAGSMTSANNDAVADYEAALEAGKPIYILFHSLTCDPCVEISAVADGVLPDYADRVTFVNAITTDPAAQQLAARFAFQYIPTSFFLRSDGSVIDSHTGPLSEDEMRQRLDAIVGETAQ